MIGDHTPAIIEDLSRQLTAPAEALRYMLAGRSTFTLRSTNTGKRYTYKVTRIKNAPTKYWVSLMTGPNNEGDFTYLGMITVDRFALTSRSRMQSSSAPVAAIKWTLEKLKKELFIPQGLEIWHSGRCGRCGKTLTVPESIANGIGPECAKKM